MTKHNSSTNAMSSTRALNRPQPLHQKHTWLIEGAQHDPQAIFAARVMDATRGARVIANILFNHMTDLNAIADDPNSTRPLLSENDTEALAGLMLFALDTLYKASSDKVDEINNQAASKG